MGGGIRFKVCEKVNVGDRMKKILIVGLLLTMCNVFSNEYSHTGFSAKCCMCVERHKQYSGYHINIARRTSKPYRKEGEDVYALYKCDGGHVYWAKLN